MFATITDTGGDRAVSVRWEAPTPAEEDALIVAARPLEPDFAVREVLTADADDGETVWRWLTDYGLPYLDLEREPFETADVNADWAIRVQRRAMTRARQAATFVLGELLDVPDVPPTYTTPDAPADGPGAGDPGWEASQWIGDRLRFGFAPTIVTTERQLRIRQTWRTWDEIVAVQLFNFVSARPTWQLCENAPWHGNALGPDVLPPWFTVQRTDRRKRGGHGPQDAGKRVRFCTRQCAKAFTERERRRRRTKENST